jgi:hypothetical protein
MSARRGLPDLHVDATHRDDAALAPTRNGEHARLGLHADEAVGFVHERRPGITTVTTGGHR